MASCRSYHSTRRLQLDERLDAVSTTENELGRFGAFTLSVSETPGAGLRIKVRQGRQLVATHEHPILSVRELKTLADAPLKVVSLQRILSVVAEHYGIPELAIRSQNRTRTIILPRHIVCYLAYRLMNYTYIEIGGVLGSRDHSTVLYAVRRVEEKMIVDESIRKIIEVFKVKLHIA